MFKRPKKRALKLVVHELDGGLILEVPAGTNAEDIARLRRLFAQTSPASGPMEKRA